MKTKQNKRKPARSGCRARFSGADRRITTRCLYNVYLPPLLQTIHSDRRAASIIENWSTGFMPAGHELVVAAQDCAHDLRDERVVTCCILLFSHRACQKSCIIAAGRERHKAAQQLPPEAAV
jgi:hypothetical protein